VDLKLSSEWYIEVSEGVKRKTPPEMINVSDLKQWQKKNQDSKLGLFRSIYEYPTDDPYVGGVISDFYVDLDCEENPDRARKEAVALVKTLINDYDIQEEIINIAFSGMKGISICVAHEVFDVEAAADLPLIWKSIAKNMISKLSLKTIDTQVYERRRLWRLINSKHQKSGLYKIPLTITELEKLSIKEIKEKAVKPRPQPFMLGKIQPIPKAVSLFREHAKKVEEWKQKRKAVFKELASLGKEDPPCVQRLFEQGAEEDARNISLFQLAVYWTQKGLAELQIVKLGYEFAEHCKQGAHPFPEGNEIETTVHSAYEGAQGNRYSVGCSSEVFAPLCDRERCPFFVSAVKGKPKTSSGENLEDYVFEQTGEKYIVFDKNKLEVVGEKDSFNNFKPLSPCLLTTPSSCKAFETVEVLWNEIRQFIYEHVDLREDSDYDVLAAWITATWTPELWNAVPYLFFFGPAASGKTWALEVLKELSFRGFMSASASPAVLYYICEEWRPTLFLDETEIYLREHKADVVNLLNSGYRKGQYAVRVGEPDRKTGARKILTFKVFGFKALAGTMEFVETLKSRCIIINMAKAIRKVRNKINKEKAEDLRNHLLMYRFRQLSHKDWSYTLPEDLRLDGRLKELFEPLIIVAPEKMQLKLIRIAEKTQKTLEEEEKLSLEATVFHAIVKAYESTGKEGKVSIRNVTDIINADLPIQDQIEPTAAGYVSSRLGFKKIRYRNQRCIIWDKRLVERLAKRYPIEPVESVEEVEVPQGQKQDREWLEKYLK
jgi:hypothetical protein